MTEDRELVALLKAGNVGSLEQLITRWRSWAETYAVSILHDPGGWGEFAVRDGSCSVYVPEAGLLVKAWRLVRDVK